MQTRGSDDKFTRFVRAGGRHAYAEPGLREPRPRRVRRHPAGDRRNGHLVLAVRLWCRNFVVRQRKLRFVRGAAGRFGRSGRRESVACQRKRWWRYVAAGLGKSGWHGFVVGRREPGWPDVAARWAKPGWRAFVVCR
ncbi:hypothetical protein GCM10009565_94830 [Amycolatopsis albidoflavus]|uniref:hypothetical protein n=1 Tax=Amycolatopsis sp. NPDC000740 TaxID=3154269 RepID=UPI00331F899A